MRNRLLAVLGFLLFFQLAAHANLFAPTLVDIIVAPTFWSMYVVTMLVTVPVLMVIALIESFVLQRYLVVGTKIKLFWGLFGLNAFTSLFRLPADLHGGILWYSLLISFGLTILIEALLLWASFRETLDITGAKKALKLSAMMNSASYAAISLTLCGLIYIPNLFNENNDVKERAGGRVIAYWDNNQDIIDVKTAHLDKLTTKDNVLLSRQNIRFVNKQLIGILDEKEYLLKIDNTTLTGYLMTDTNLPAEQHALYSRLLNPKKQLPEPVESYWIDISNDAKFIVYHKDRELRLYNTEVKSEIPLTSLKSFPAFSPDGSKYAGITSDYNHIMMTEIASKVSSTLKAPGVTSSSSMAWSPDGKYIAYIGTANPFTSQRWTPGIRILELATGKSATICNNIFTSGRSVKLLWIE